MIKKILLLTLFILSLFLVACSSSTEANTPTQYNSTLLDDFVEGVDYNDY